MAGIDLQMLHDVFGPEGEAYNIDIVYIHSADMCADIHTKSFTSLEKWTHARKLINVVSKDEIVDRILEHHRSFVAFLDFWKNSPACLHKIPKRKPVKDESQFVRLPEVPYFEDPDDMYHYDEGSSD